jgi:hypothetical protein
LLLEYLNKRLFVFSPHQRDITLYLSYSQEAFQVFDPGVLAWFEVVDSVIHLQLFLLDAEACLYVHDVSIEHFSEKIVPDSPVFNVLFVLLAL